MESYPHSTAYVLYYVEQSYENGPGTTIQSIKLTSFVFPDTTKQIATIKTVRIQAASLDMAEASATLCPLAKGCTILSIVSPETKTTTVMNGQWQLSNRTVSKRVQSGIAFVALMRMRTPVSRKLLCLSSSTKPTGGGSQLEVWIEGNNNQDEKIFPKKTCSGKVGDGDFWTVEFRTDDVKNK